MRPQTAKAQPSLEDVAARYAVAITPAMAALIDASDPSDPIAAQFAPDVRELDSLPHERSDPIGDDAHAAASCLVHRYPDRVLLKLVNVCPVYCRFCFRRETVGQPIAVSAEVLEEALRYIRADAKIWEVILTGGDPFMVSPRRAAQITQALSAIDHVKIVRWHTRVPVVAPERITAEFVEGLRADGVTTYVVLHANHPRELTPHARTAISRIIDAGIPMLSQSVLLRGVNDDAETLESLMRTFVELRIKPYYLHHGDLAPGTSHFRTTIEQGQALMQSLHDVASGLCQPHYVIDSPGGHGKAPLAPPSARRTQDGWLLRGRDGAWRRYEDPQ